MNDREDEMMPNERPGHPEPGTLYDLVDAVLPSNERDAIEAHVHACALCSAEVGRLRALLADAAALPVSIEPPARVWEEVEAKVARGASRGAAGVHRRFSFTGPQLAAASIALLVVGAATMKLASRERDASSVAVSTLPGGQRTEVASRDARRASLASLESDYMRAARELAAALDAERGRMAPETIAQVERSVGVIDAAIREAHDALARDPDDEVLTQVLSATYERKLDLLRRAAQLGAGT